MSVVYCKIIQESMSWVVMNKPIHVTAKQRDSLRLLMQVCGGHGWEKAGKDRIGKDSIG